MYLEASAWQLDQYAILATPPLNYSGSVCVSFYFHMYGTNVNRLKVYKNSERNSSTFEKKGAQGQDWVFGIVEFQISSGDRISFDASCGANWLGDIAIDTLLVTGSQCPCTSNPCHNDGICHASSSGYTCACKPGWMGELCEIGKGYLTLKSFA